MNKWYKIFISFVVIVFLVVVGGIAWVQYYYLPHIATEYAAFFSASGTVATSPNSAVTPSPKTAAAMIAIQEVTSGAAPGYWDQVPIPRTLQPISSDVHTELSYRGYTIDVPWTSVTTSTRKGNPLAFIDDWFNNGRRLSLMELSNSDTSTVAQWHSFSSTINTNYDLENAAFNVAPDQVNASTPGDEAALVSLLLDMKTGLFLPTPVYSFNTGVVKGFQFGTASTTHQIDTQIFSESGYGEFHLIISGTQGEIDYTLASIKAK